MGASQSSGGVEISGGPMGYQVLRVYPDSPGSKAGLKAYFDFIVAIGTTRFSKEDGSLREILKASVDQKLKMIVFNTRSKAAREVDIVPSNSWGGSGLLGVSIKHSSFERADERVWHVIAVDPGSPAQQAGFKAVEDYVIGSDSILQENDDLYNLIEAHEGKALKLFVYNTKSDNCREVICHPNSRWGGRGYLGCEFGHGLLHRIPYAESQQAGGALSSPTMKAPTTMLSGDRVAGSPQTATIPNNNNSNQHKQLPQQQYQLQQQQQQQSSQPLNNSSMFPLAQSQQTVAPHSQVGPPVRPGNQMFQQALFANAPPYQQQQVSPMQQQPQQQQQQQSCPAQQQLGPPMQQQQQGPPPQQHQQVPQMQQQPPDQMHQQLPAMNQYQYAQPQQHYQTWAPPPMQPVPPQQHSHQYTPQEQQQQLHQQQAIPQMQQQTLLTQQFQQQQPLPPPPPPPPSSQQPPASSDKLPVAHTFAQLASVGAAADHSPPSAQDLPT